VRVIGADGSQVGVIPTPQAMRMAEELNLQLVEVNPRSSPPVCRIMDYGKFKYETAKKEQASRKHQAVVVLKEIKIRPKTGKHDQDFKVKHIRTFLLEGNKCKLVVVFRGREIVHPETGRAMLQQIIDATADLAQIEQTALMEGRRMVMIIGPKRGLIRPAPAAPRPDTSSRLDEPSPVLASQAASPNGGVSDTAEDDNDDDDDDDDDMTDDTTDTTAETA
jgi:translation initiation factor IF-3